jgi:hypothetical protein
MMLTTDGVYKSIALPPRVLENGLNSEIPKPGLGHSYTKLSNGSSEIEMDTIVEVEDLSVDGRPVLSSEESGDWSSSSSVPELASISEPTRHPRRVRDHTSQICSLFSSSLFPHAHTCANLLCIVICFVFNV